MRDLILKAKVENNLHALEFIVDLFLSKLKLNQELISAAAILAMPSSLWSRLNGKYDLAFHLAQSATLLLNLKLHRPPLKVGWHLKKQSRLSSEVRKKTILVPELNQAQNRPSDFLIIDDIHTSGNSFAKLQRALYPKTCSFLGLCYTDQD